MRKHLIPAALMLAATLASAQTTALNGTSSASTPAKKDLVQRLLVLQQPALDSMARNLAEQPARQMMASAEQVLQQKIAADKREGVASQIQGDVRKYMDESVPILGDRANKIAQAQIAPALEERFSEDELKQLVAFLESPVSKKYQTTMPELSTQLIQKLVADARPQIDPKVQALERNIAGALGVLPSPGAASAAGTSSAKPATKTK